MTDNDKQIVLGLDVPKTAAQINADIKKLQPQLKTIEIKAAINTKDVNKAARQTGADIAQNIASGITQSGDKVDSAVQKLACRQTELQEFVKEMRNSIHSGGQKEVNDSVQKTESSLRGLAKLGAAFQSHMSQATQSLAKLLSVNSIVSRLISETQKAVSELKEIDTLLTNISITNEKLSKSDLDKFGDNSFAVAAKYGKAPTDYLSGVQEASRAGYQNAEDIAELSVAAQSTGGITAQLANQYIFATDKAYKMSGSVEKLTEVLDGSNNITNHNAVKMAELAEGMSIVGSTAASCSVDVDQAAAGLSTMIAATHQSGSDMAGAFQSILFYLQQVTATDKNIDAKGLAKYEKACQALNVSLRETKNGVSSLRDPMEIIKDLAAEYSRLDSGDARRSDLLSAVGDKVNANAFHAILENYDLYEKMLQEYANGTGSMAAEVERITNSWEGSLNRLSNTWTDTVANIADSDAIAAAINSLNSLLSVVDHVTDKLDFWGTMGAMSGLLMNKMGIGERTMFQW